MTLTRCWNYTLMIRSCSEAISSELSVRLSARQVLPTDHWS